VPDIIQLPPGTVTTDQPLDFMVDQVCALIGRSNDPELRTLALNSLDRASDNINAAGVLLYRQKEASFTGFTSAQATLTKPSDFAWPIDPAYCYDTPGNILSRIEWKTWDVFEATLRNVGDTGRPTWASLRSPLDDDIYISPLIDPTNVTTIKMAYIARLQRPSEATGSTLRLIPEVREALIRGGEAYVMRLRYAKYPNIWTPFWGQFKESILSAQAADRRWLATAHLGATPDMAGNLTSLPGSFKPSGIINIRVGQP